MSNPMFQKSLKFGPFSTRVKLPKQQTDRPVNTRRTWLFSQGTAVQSAKFRNAHALKKPLYFAILMIATIWTSNTLLGRVVDKSLKIKTGWIGGNSWEGSKKAHMLFSCLPFPYTLKRKNAWFDQDCVMKLVDLQYAWQEIKCAVLASFLGCWLKLFLIQI